MDSRSDHFFIFFSKPSDLATISMLAKDLAPYLQAIEVLRNLELIDTKDRETARKNWHGAKLLYLDVVDLLEYY